MAKPTKAERFTNFRLQLFSCVRCPYSNVRKSPIIGDGEYRSPILIIGPSARQRDDAEGEVFAGRAGTKLQRMLGEAGLNIDHTYRTYAVRCYGGRDPDFGEFAALKRCRAHTEDLIGLMRPLAVVICGFKVFKWMLLRFTSETVEEQAFYKWIGKTVRLKDAWGDLKFFIIENPAELSKVRNFESEAKSIDLLRSMKAYVVAQQKGEPHALDMTDLVMRGRTKAQQQTFGWS